MSTRGSFIIRKSSESKELYVPMDAYPAGAGRDAVRLIIKGVHREVKSEGSCRQTLGLTDRNHI